MTEKLNDGFRVITQEETPLYRAHVWLFDVAKDGLNYIDGPLDIDKREVPVYASTNGPVVGSAHLFCAQPGFVEALLVFDYHSPERLDLQVDNPIYAVPIGSYTMMGEKVCGVEVDGIILHDSSGGRAGRITPIPNP